MDRVPASVLKESLIKETKQLLESDREVPSTLSTTLLQSAAIILIHSVKIHRVKITRFVKFVAKLNTYSGQGRGPSIWSFKRGN